MTSWIQRRLSGLGVGWAYGKWLGVVAVALAVAACDNHRTLETDDGEGASAEARAPQAGEGDDNQPGAAARPTSQNQSTRYRTRVYPQKVEVGSTTRVHFDVVANRGWKVNEEFNQWSLRLTPETMGAVQRDTFETGEFDITDKRARATTSVTVPEDASPGDRLNVEGTATFSICTDETCRIKRDEALSFGLEIVDATPAPPAGSGPRPYR